MLGPRRPGMNMTTRKVTHHLAALLVLASGCASPTPSTVYVAPLADEDTPSRWDSASGVDGARAVVAALRTHGCDAYVLSERDQPTCFVPGVWLLWSLTPPPRHDTLALQVIRFVNQTISDDERSTLRPMHVPPSRPPFAAQGAVVEDSFTLRVPAGASDRTRAESANHIAARVLEVIAD